MATEMDKIRIEAMADILTELNITLSPQQIETVVKDFSHHIEMEREMASYSYTGSGSIECEKCKRLSAENAQLNKDISVYQDSVKKRRSAERVWIQDDTVMYE